MVGPERETKFTNPLVHAFHALTRAVEHQKPIVCLTSSKEFIDECLPIAESLASAMLPAWGQIVQVAQWSAWDHSPFSPVASSLTQKLDRLKILKLLSDGSKPLVLFCMVDAWVQPTLPEDLYRKQTRVFKAGDDIGTLEDFRTLLRNNGYVKTETVEEAGQYAIRGELCDLFIASETQPIRIELFDTLIERIRPFHPGTQRTFSEESKLHSFTLAPAEEALIPWDNLNPFLEKLKEYCDAHHISRKVRDPIFENIRTGFLPEQFRTWIPFLYQKEGFLRDYLPSTAEVISFEPAQIRSRLSNFLTEQKKEFDRYEQRHWISPDFDLLYKSADPLMEGALNSSAFLITSTPTYNTTPPPVAFDQISGERITEARIRDWIDDGYWVLIGARGLTHQERIKFLVKDLISRPNLKILSEDPLDSAEFLLQKVVVLSETLLFGKQGAATKKPRRTKLEEFKETDITELTQIHDLSPGDFIVHTFHGVGKYIGLQELKNDDRSLGEYLLIEYSAGDKLYLPVYRLNIIQRYVGAGANPALDKLGGDKFEKAKAKAKESARKLAVNLIEIYAKRAVLKGAKFSSTGEDYDEFVDEFEFTETEGQLKATHDTLQDLESGKLLDRLVCGDVGFGKTEVAMRAAFQAVQSGYQVAVLVPTTLLAFQHEQSFKHRMKDHPVKIDSISRFKNKKQQSETLKQLEEGQLDILIGTHRLLSKDVKFNRLGLLVIDEEHRFGVDHKEKIKAIQANTHTLTLTATPIPRTLNMALSGLKDISIIKTPPTNRQPIKTYVSHHSDELIKSAIETELARGGQIFYLYNKVASIDNQAKEIQKLVPNAKIIVAHGQMSEDEIESKMLDFYHGYAQVLVCTTIIESGIDVPNAGTIIIHRADTLGLAQLYQIRGRVGRSHRKAFAYLLTDEGRVLTQEAKTRLDVLQRFVELGSGFQIASYDLEIRGGGNFLGAEQSGHIASVGLDLFTELLEEAIQELKGSPINVEDRHFEPEIQAPVIAEISPSLVSDSKLRLSLYRRLSNAKSSEQVDKLHDELADRFGELPTETENLFWLIRLKNLFKRVGVEAASITVKKAAFTVRKSTLIELDEVMKLYAGPKGVRDPRVQITPDSKIVLQLQFDGLKAFVFETENFFKKIAPKAFEIQKSH
ncbi:MAG: transcription-repair coupling factor [Bdellovibrionales bacterium]|nr:transcription-repair coupling factor [Bdellovibrionales bacterium]